jgi:dTDP-4-dehydrorhamnose reductase
MKPRILLAGKNGQVGSELARLLPSMGELTAVGRNELDLAKPADIRRVIAQSRPNLVINAAAYTAVDQAEKEEPLARAINADAPAVIAEAAKKLGALLIHYSTDYVFDGAKREPYVETDLTNPLNVYGRTKLAGEEAIRSSGAAHLILRTAWVYATSGKNFLLTILRLATTREELRIVNDQFGAPTCAREIAAATARLLTESLAADVKVSSRVEPRAVLSVPREARARDAGPLFASHADSFAFLADHTGTYHLTAAGETTWYEFGVAILDALRNESARIPPDTPWLAAATAGRPFIAKYIVPITTQECPTPVRRPAYSVLSNVRFASVFGFYLPHWRSQLAALSGLPHPTSTF